MSLCQDSPFINSSYPTFVMKDGSRFKDRGICKYGCSRTVQACHCWARNHCRYGKGCRHSHQLPEARRTRAGSSSHQRPEAHAPVPTAREEKKDQTKKRDHSMISANLVPSCPICLELATIDSGAFVSLQCSHTFHEDCINPVMQMPASQQKCPVCVLK